MLTDAASLSKSVTRTYLDRCAWAVFLDLNESSVRCQIPNFDSFVISCQVFSDLKISTDSKYIHQVAAYEVIAGSSYRGV